MIFKQLARTGNAPVVGPGGLYIRPGHDVDASSDSEAVKPGDGGMSVTPDDPMLMPQFCRPASLFGTGKKPVWRMDPEALDAHGLRDRLDAPGHALVEVASPTTLGDFQVRIGATAGRWELAYE